jgi:23S rRNA (uracil1939-C5)-methyltransferase
MNEPVEIIGLGHSGHGVTAEGVFIPYTAPGDVVRLTRREGKRGAIGEIMRPSALRRNPPCGYFTRCGGCALQHIAPEAYLDWKREQVAVALAQRGFKDVAIDAILSVPRGTRRRAAFKARKERGILLLGFYEAESHRIVDIESCPLLVLALARLLPVLRERLAPILANGDAAELHATASDTGVDLSLRWKGARGPDVLMQLADLAQAAALARLSWNGELVAQTREPVLRIGNFTAALPPEPFLQPTREGEQVLQKLVQEGVGGAKHVADLFAGCGTFALSLVAPGRTVHAADASGPMIAALTTAVRGRTDVTTEERDLFRQPLSAEQLARFDAVVIDPPRPGAKAQAEQLSASRVDRIVYVSCSPASFARDARILVNGGYSLTRVTPVDQFLWSPHVELVALFRRDGN